MISRSVYVYRLCKFYIGQLGFTEIIHVSFSGRISPFVLDAKVLFTVSYDYSSKHLIIQNQQ